MKAFHLLYLFLLLSINSLLADTIITEDITQQEVWTEAGSPYLIKNSLTITETGSLVIEAGVVVKFQTPASVEDNIRIVVRGKIQVLGKPQTRRVVFTSSKDDVFGGDTNLDGLANVPDFGDWLGFQIVSDFADECIFNHCMFRYGGFSTTTYGAIQIIKGSPTISNGYFYRCAKDIVVRGTGTPRIENNLFERTGWTPVSISISANPTFSGNIFKNVGLEFLGIESGAYFLYGRYNLPQRNLGGIENIPYFIQRDVTLEYGMTLDVEPGVVIKFNVPPLLLQNPRITVNGVLNAIGTIDQPIFFTSERDDAIRGDGNNDGNANPAGPGDWYGIELRNTALPSKFAFCHFRYGGYHPEEGYGALRIVGNHTEVRQSVFAHNSKGIVIKETSKPVLTENHFERNAWVPISLELGTSPAFNQNTFDHNNIDALGIEGGSYRSGSPFILDKTSVGGLDNTPYFIQDDVIIEKGSHLEIRPGVVIKFNTVAGNLPHVGIKIRGHLHAVGNSEEPIVFTSERDDAFGGDSNNDGDSNPPATGDWWGIQLEASASASVIEQVIFRYGGYSPNAYGAVYAEGGDHEVKHCTFFKNSKGVVLREDAGVRLIENTFESSGWVPVSKSFAAKIYSRGNIFIDNPINALGLEGGEYLKGAKYRLENVDLIGAGSAVYFIHEDIVLGTAVQLKIDPGVIIKFDVAPRLEDNYALRILGDLQAIGTDEEPIVFTSERDDAYGGDTNNNGTANQATFGDWLGVELEGPIADHSIMKHCVFRYGGYRKVEGLRKVDYGVLRIKNAKPLIQSNLFKYNYKHLVLLDRASPKIVDNRLESSAKVAVSRSLNSNPVFTANHFQHNAINALGLEVGNADGVAVYQLKKTSFNGNPNIPFYIDGQLEIGIDQTLKIDPGVTLRFVQPSGIEAGGGLLIDGQLQAEGTPEEPIIFTSEFDHECGGIIHRDLVDQASFGDWTGLEIRGSTASRISNCHFRYGGAMYNGEGGVLKILDSSPVVKDCQFEHNDKGLVVWAEEALSLSDCTYLHNKIGLSVMKGMINVDRNKFSENVNYDIENRSEDPVFAENNEWDFYHQMQIMLKGDEYNLENIFDQHDDASRGKVYLALPDNPDYFIYDVFPKEVEKEDSEVQLTVQGFRFQQGTKVILRKEWQPDIVAWVMEEQENIDFELQVTMLLDGAAPGTYDLIVINPDGRLMRLDDGFRILGDEPVLEEAEKLLLQNFPNPFYEETEIRFLLPQATEVKVEILGENGLLIPLLDQKLNAGRHAVIWAGEQSLPGGIYYCRLTIGDHVEVRKVMYMRE